MQRSFPAPVVQDFEAVLRDENYGRLPDCAFVAVTDVVSSTAAISDGRYKDVNLAGAAGIAAFANSFPDWDLPSAFGGDGAAIILPEDVEREAREVLPGLLNTCRRALGLGMRAALFRVADLRARGCDVRLSYHSLSPHRRLPMLSGGGVATAETLSKGPDAEAFLICPDPAAPEPSLEGLSCRWQPVKPKRGVMLSLVIETGGPPSSYAHIYREIGDAADGPLHPLAKSRLKPGWPPRAIAPEIALNPAKASSRAGLVAEAAIAATSILTGLTLGGFNGRSYRDSIKNHSDALKFADSLRMVIDCSQAEADAVQERLVSLASSEGFAFGLQRSSSAVMTCFVQSTRDGGHLHFIDGADGGYTLAAQAMKSRKPAVLPLDHP